MQFDKLKSFMDELTGWRIPGNSVVVYKDNKEVFRYSSGYSDVENKILMDGNELFNIYSCSKPITVVAAMQLFEQGKFLLSDPLYEYIPEFKDMTVRDSEGNIKPAKNPITIWNLFTMTAGFTYNMDLPAFDEAKRITDGKCDTLTVARCLAKEPLAFEPGERWQYSVCHDVLAAVVVAITGKKFKDYVADNIFAPLDMNESFYHNEHVRGAMAQQYLWEDADVSNAVSLQAGEGSRDGGRLVNIGKDVAHTFGSEYDSGGAGVVTSISDYGKFAATLANNGVGLNGNRIISKATIDLIRTNQLSQYQRSFMVWPQLKGYGYGLGVRTMIDKVSGGANGNLGEFGWGGAAGATLLVDPDIKLGVAYAHHMKNPQEHYYQPRLRNVVYSCL